MQIIVTGGKGQLGRSISKITPDTEAVNINFIDIEELDITDNDEVDRYFLVHPCDILINCAAYTAVDKAEEEREKAEAINCDAIQNLANAALKHNFKIIHISTDYVFDGANRTPYKESDITDPITVYGKTKLKGENSLLSIKPDSIIIRTAWLYSEFGRNFFLTMRNKALAGETVRVVEDQVGTPTYAGDLAKAILEIVYGADWTSGIYHYTNLGETTWFGFTQEIYRLLGVSTELVRPIKTAEFKSLARRPQYSVLDKTKIKQTFGIEIADWQSSLAAMVESTTEK